MSIHRTSKSGLFLLELIIIILFFSFTGAVCVRLFVSAHLTSQASRELNQGMLEVQTAAECIKETGWDEARLRELLPLEPRQDGSFARYYNEDWLPVSAEQAVYTLSIRQSGDDPTMLCAHVAVGSSRQEIFAVDVKRFLGGEGGATG